MVDSDDNPLGISIFWSHSRFPVPHKHLPPTLWHVRHGDSQSYAGHHGGFIAAAGFRKIKDNADLKLEATRPFDWYTHLYEETLDWKSSFISVFENRRHAENWGRQRAGPVEIYEIDTTKLSPRTIVFDAVELCDLLEIDHPWAEDEFLFLNGIPGNCFVGQYQLNGGQYIRQPEVTDIIGEFQGVLAVNLDMSSRANSINS